jgi:hypothetical protein
MKKISFLSILFIYRSMASKKAIKKRTVVTEEYEVGKATEESGSDDNEVERREENVSGSESSEYEEVEVDSDGNDIVSGDDLESGDDEGYDEEIEGKMIPKEEVKERILPTSVKEKYIPDPEDDGEAEDNEVERSEVIVKKKKIYKKSPKKLKAKAKKVLPKPKVTAKPSKAKKTSRSGKKVVEDEPSSEDAEGKEEKEVSDEGNVEEEVIEEEEVPESPPKSKKKNSVWSRCQQLKEFQRMAI